MRRNMWQYLAIVVLSLSLLALLLTGLMLWWVLPPGSRGATVWGLTRHQWGDVHFWASAVMLVGVAWHLVQNWGWFCTVSVRLIHRKAAAPSRAKRNAAGAATVVAVVLACVLFVMLAQGAKVPDRIRGGRGADAALQHDHDHHHDSAHDHGQHHDDIQEGAGHDGTSDDLRAEHDHGAAATKPDGVGRGQGGQGRGLHRRSQRHDDE